MADSSAAERGQPPRSTLAPWLLRLFYRQYEPESEIQKKHRQMIELIWTRSGMGERYFVTLQPAGVKYGEFVRRFDAHAKLRAGLLALAR